MADLGSMALLLALALGAYAVVGSLLGARRGIPELVTSARYATYLLPLVLGTAVLALVAAFVSRDFSLQYVFQHSDLSMSNRLIWVAFYAGNEGSLLFIAFALAVLSAVAVALAPRQVKASLPYTNAVLMLVLLFFTGVLLTLANPFTLMPFVPADGNGINPLLKHEGMFFHPPTMMMGLVATAIPFAFAMGALLSGKTGDEWVVPGRTWGLVAWAMLGSGLLLGAWWAYTILGWGGYWGWDPIENSGLMPWLVLTAFIHSIMVQKRRGMFRMWNLALIIIAFGFAQFGMFLNRGGPVPSVHSFAQSALGWTFLSFMAATMLASGLVFLWRYNRLKSSQSLESALSREAAFLVNNLLFLGIALVTLWGVIFPLISQALQGVTVSLAAPFYNQVNGPLFLALIFLMGVGPLLPWRRANAQTLKQALLVPGVAALGLVVLLAVLGVGNPYALFAFGLCALVATAILQEWARGTRARHSKGEPYLVAFLRLLVGNRPRYGGYIVHLAIVLLALGITGSSFFDVQRDVRLLPGEEVTVGRYAIQYVDGQAFEGRDRIEFVTTVNFLKDGAFVSQLTPRRSIYPQQRLTVARAAIRSTPVEDFYVIPSEVLDDGSIIFRVFINPLVMWMWVAGPVFILGTVVALWPQREQAVARVSQTRRAMAPAPRVTT
ncbi:MAG: heme lyase CcmF/NrfE family subunit [Dehalococcoidia bacterium]